jgi:uncharacterized protein
VHPLIAISANDIDLAGVAVDVELPREWISARLEDEDVRATANGKLTARLSRTGKADVVVRGHVTASVEAPCARCLKPTPVDVKGELALVLKPKAPASPPLSGRLEQNRTRPSPPSGSKAPAPELPRAAGEKKPHREKGKPMRAASPEYEFSSEEADVDEYDGETVILDPFVREAILLELPNFPLCSESCPGISHASLAKKREGTTASPIRANPFEALKYLRPNLGQHVPAEGADPLGDGSDSGTSNGADESSPIGTRAFSGVFEARAATAKSKKSETKIASTHAAPRRRPSSKKKGDKTGASRGTKRTKRT